MVFDVCDRIVCINIPVFNDNNVENNDMGMIRVHLKPHPFISYNVSKLIIEVQDDDYGE